MRHPTSIRVWNRAAFLLKYRQYIPTEFYTHEKKKIVYISVPKVACTAIKLALFGDAHRESSEHREYMNIHRFAARYCSHTPPKNIDAYKLIAFVRNPVSRLISCYNDKVKKLEQHSGHYYFDTRYNKVLIRRLYGDFFSPGMSFEAFINLVCKIPDYVADGHFKSQYSILAPRGMLLTDTVGKFETMEKDWNAIATQFDIPTLQVRNPVSQKIHEIRDNQISPELKTKIHQRFNKDFSEFNYNAD